MRVILTMIMWIFMCVCERACVFLCIMYDSWQFYPEWSRLAGKVMALSAIQSSKRGISYCIPPPHVTRLYEARLLRLHSYETVKSFYDNVCWFFLWRRDYSQLVEVGCVTVFIPMLVSRVIERAAKLLSVCVECVFDTGHNRCPQTRD